MTILKNFLDNDIYPAVFEIAYQVLPEFDFKKKGNHWESGNDLKVDGSRGEKHKVYIYPDTPHYLKDFTRGGEEIATYLVKSGKYASNIEAIKYLADMVGIPLPNSSKDIAKYEKESKRKTLLETINDFFVTSFTNGDGKDFEDIKQYLHDRGYADYLPKSLDEMNLSDKMELGFIPSRKALEKHLEVKGISQGDIESHFGLEGKEANGIDCLFHPSIGKTHKLAIPFRVNGRIIGFAFRATDSCNVGKYLYSTGLDKSSTLFNLKHPRNNKDLIIVEGLFDALHAEVYGIENVAALGGASLNSGQADLIKKYRYESVTLCLDNDLTGKESAQKVIDEILKADSNLKIYVATLPAGVKDPDEFIRKDGIDAFAEVIKNADSWYEYKLEVALNGLDVSNITKTTSKDRDRIVNVIIAIGSKMPPSPDRDIFLSKAEALGISKETINEEHRKIEKKRREEQQQIEYDKDIRKATDLLKQGEILEVIDLLSNCSKHCNHELSNNSFEELFKPYTEDMLREKLKSKSAHLDSGFKIEKEDLLIPSGAITIVAAPTSHGKTSFLINLGINIATSPDNKPVYLFSFEESREAIYMKALNTYIDKELSANNRRSIETYFKTVDTRFMTKEGQLYFQQGKPDFFTKLIHSGQLNILYSSYTAEDLIRAIYHLHEKGNVSAILIDYMQLLRLEENKSLSRPEELKQICLKLKDCAVETGLPIVLGAQFNRSVTSADKMHPTTIGEAGDIERIANLIIGLWNKNFPELDKNGKKEDNFAEEDKIDIRILKNRDGVVGLKEIFNFNGNTGKISNDNFQNNHKKKNRDGWLVPRNTGQESSAKEYEESTDGF